MRYTRDGLRTCLKRGYKQVSSRSREIVDYDVRGEPRGCTRGAAGDDPSHVVCRTEPEGRLVKFPTFDIAVHDARSALWPSRHFSDYIPEQKHCVLSRTSTYSFKYARHSVNNTCLSAATTYISFNPFVFINI